MGSVLIAGIILFFAVFLGALIITKIFIPISFPPKDEPIDPAFQNVNWPILLVCLSILYGPFVLGMLWAWTKVCFFIVEPDGSWTLRNSFYISIGQIPPETPRTLEVLVKEIAGNQNTRKIQRYYDGEVWITPENQHSFSLSNIVLEKASDERPAFLVNLGYTDPDSPTPGPNGGTLFPKHTFSASGPVFLLPAEKQK